MNKGRRIDEALREVDFEIREHLIVFLFVCSCIFMKL